MNLKMYKLPIVMIATLMYCFSCGPHTEVNYHTLPIEQVREICFQGRDGCALWKSWKGPEFFQVKCDIYLAPPEFYKTEACYNDVIAHERHHCYEKGDELPLPNCPQYSQYS